MGLVSAGSSVDEKIFGKEVVHPVRSCFFLQTRDY